MRLFGSRAILASGSQKSKLRDLKLAQKGESSAMRERGKKREKRKERKEKEEEKV